MEVIFTVNKKKCKIVAGEMPPDTSLNMYLRTRLCLTGTKFMCQEGGCGCCIVTIHGSHPVTKENFTLAVNSCLYLVYSCHGLDVTTVEGLGDKKTGYHPIQQRLAQFNGSQCGYCSPGFVMNMYGLYESRFGSVSAEEVEDSFGENICRCTGYRPILDAFKSFANDAPQELRNLCGDIEELSVMVKKCSRSDKMCFNTCRSAIRVKAADNAEWHKVYTLSEVLQTLEAIGDKKYRLVAGNTAHGIYRMPYDIEVFIDVSAVAELRTYTIGSTIVLGGNVTITEFMAILLEAADRTNNFNYCRTARDYINLMATVPVRNVGTIAGNLMIKHDHPEFPSDIFLLLETIGATLTIVDTGNVPETLSPLDFLSKDMQKHVIKEVTLPQLTPSIYRLRLYKIMDRAQNAIAYMNAGFLFEMSQGSGVTKSTRIVYGGVNSKFVHATSIEKILKRMNLFENTTIKTVIDAIYKDFIIDDTLPNASAIFRQKLAIGLFYRTVLSLAPSTQVRPIYKSGTFSIPRPLSAGQQTYETFPPKYPISQPITKIEALWQCSGEAEYVNDIEACHALWATFVLSKDPMKTIASIDPTEALKVRGVKAFYSAKDIPGVNSFISRRHISDVTTIEPEEVFCSGKVLYHGQPVGVIVAEEMSQAVYAADLVKINYESKVEEEKGAFASLYKYLTGSVVTESKEKILATLADVLEEDPNLTKDRFQAPIVVKVATQQGIGEAEGNVKGHLMCGPQYHYTMETQQTVAIPMEDGIDIYPSTQFMDVTNMGVADVLGVKNSYVRIHIRRLGGAFGGKIYRATWISCAAAIACHLTGQPIRMVLPMITNMRAIGKRIPAFIEYNVDFAKTGAITKLFADVTHDLGCSINERMEDYANLFTANTYVTTTWSVTFQYVITDAASNCSMRGPGSVEMIANTETIMENIAWALKMDPVKVRLANIDSSSPMVKIYNDFLSSCDYYKRLNEVNKYNTMNRWKKRGIATSIMQFPTYFGSTYEALVSIYHADGSVVISLGGIEMGQGLNTKCVQIAASIFNIPMEWVRVEPANNIASPNNYMSAGNLTVDSAGMTVKGCCDTLNGRLEPFRLKDPQASWADIVQAAFAANTELTAVNKFDPSQMDPYNVYGAACSEIEIDVLTGDFQLRRVDIVEDVGQTISPMIDVGQVEGAYVQGLGYWLHEKLVYDRSTGELLTDRAWTYKPPGVKDIPVDFRVTLLQTRSDGAGILGSKCVSEPSICLAVSAPLALRRALESARKDAGADNIFITINTATTKEDILILCGTKDDQYVF
ncbi:xanthine dehydrogenase-like [Phlebotomus argentipes]|uniref:xanthine dehydrogenase-like n=1 Tax=Phlebotomus argentipes TaxID=94469 RepID=UPI0028929B02|nr:xanthine dehydrogenase-like [Phlebotomus argentipes]